MVKRIFYSITLLLVPLIFSSCYALKKTELTDKPTIALVVRSEPATATSTINKRVALIVKSAPPEEFAKHNDIGEKIEEQVFTYEPALPARKIVEAESSVVERARSVLEDVLFDFDRFNIRNDARSVLDSIALFLNKEMGLSIVIEGHADERGTNEYNFALGDKRAKSVKRYLVSRGISAERILVMSSGEEKPICTEHNESCWQKNRRAKFEVKAY